MSINTHAQKIILIGLAFIQSAIHGQGEKYLITVLREEPEKAEYMCLLFKKTETNHYLNKLFCDQKYMEQEFIRIPMSDYNNNLNYIDIPDLESSRTLCMKNRCTSAPWLLISTPRILSNEDSSQTIKYYKTNLEDIDKGRNFKLLFYRIIMLTGIFSLAMAARGATLT